MFCCFPHTYLTETEILNIIKINFCFLLKDFRFKDYSCVINGKIKYSKNLHFSRIGALFLVTGGWKVMSSYGYISDKFICSSLQSFNLCMVFYLT